jgi:hypothetical protein
VRQEGANVNVPIRSQFLSALREMDYRNQPVPVLTNVENHITFNVIGILEYAADLREIVPPHMIDDTHPRRDFASGVRIIGYCLSNVLARDDVHSRAYFTIREGVKGFS